MRGKVLDYSFGTKSGLISGSDDARYRFSDEHWKESVGPVRGQAVDFQPSDGVASDIYFSEAQRPATVASGLTASMKSALIGIACAVLAFIVPIVGIVLAVVGFLFGRKAMREAVVDGDENARLVGIAAAVISAVALLFTIFGLLALMGLAGAGIGFGMLSGF